MNLSFCLIALLGVCVLIGACSTNPTVAPPPAPAPAPASSDTTNPAPTANRLYLEDKTLTNDEVRKLFEQGYKPISRNGEVYYCRREQQLGTRFETTICRTADQMKQLEQQSKDLATQKQKPSGCMAQGASC